jgi:hypothetical protein
MDKIMAELNDKFSGQAAARLGTFAGKMDLITVASADAKEIIGKGLVDALTALSNDKSIGNFTDSMKELATGIADVTRGIGELGRKIQTIANLPGLKQLLTFSYEMSAVGLLQRLGRMSAPATVLPANKQRSAGRIDAKRFQTEDKLAKAKAAELLLLQKKNAIENKNLEELQKKFDLERIGLNAALNAAVDEETKLRIKAQLAIIDNNEALAKKILAEMDAAKAAKDLATSFESGGSRLAAAMAKLEAGQDKLLANILTKVAAGTFTPPSNIALPPSISLPIKVAQLEEFTNRVTPRLQEQGLLDSKNMPNTGFNADLLGRLEDFTRRVTPRVAESNDITIRIDPSSSGDKFIQAIAESLQVAQRIGFNTAPAGSLP